MTPEAGALVTGLGLALALAGVACGVWAYVDTVRQHDTLPVWPWADRQLQRVREWRPFRRDVRQGHGTATLALAGHASGVASAFGALTVTRGCETVDQRIERLERRLEQLTQQTADERSRAKQAESQLSKLINEQGHRLDDADEQLRELARSVAVGSARLQLVGLILVDVGTSLMALPTLFATV